MTKFNVKCIVFAGFCLMITLFAFPPVQSVFCTEEGTSGSVFEKETKDIVTDNQEFIQNWRLQNFREMRLFWLDMILFIIFPRILPIIFCVKLDATLGQWIGYMLGGVILAPRLTLGLILIWYFPENQVLGWLAVVFGFILDIVEQSIFRQARM